MKQIHNCYKLKRMVESVSKLNNKAILTKNISNALIKKDDTSLNGGANCCEIFIT